ncbi:MAG TPA: flagellar basal body-associated FliL family protein [Anaerolineaceae bacterium]|nr:flagellar basal body-associated FliL family protein [Anaerolineaceae bacterium]
MNLVKKILKIAGKVIISIGLLSASLLSFCAAYIIFAPDTWPKPFYLDYIYPTPVPTRDPGATTVAPAVTPTPEIAYVPGQGIMISTGTKIINVTESNPNKYIRIGVTLEFQPNDSSYLKMTAAEKTAYVTTFTNDINPKMPLVDDTIITVLSTKTFDALYTAAGKEALREELAKKINVRLDPNFKIIAVYFTEFVIN